MIAQTNEVVTELVEQTPAVNEVEAAQLAVEAAEERLVELEQERRDLGTRLGQFTAKDGLGEFRAMQKRFEDLAFELLLAPEAITLAQIGLLEARASTARRVIAEQKPLFDDQQSVVEREQGKLHSIGMKMQPHQRLLKDSGIDLGMLNQKLDQQRGERLRQTRPNGAPVVHSIPHRGY